MKKKIAKSQKEKILWASIWLYALAILSIALIIILFISLINTKFEFYDNIPKTFLSGILGTMFSCGFVLFGFRLNNKSKIIDNQLELRKLFSEEQRREVHRTLRTNDKSYWYQKSGEKMPENMDEAVWKKSKAYKNHFLLALLDYMGLFEIAYMMIEEGQLSEKNFEVSYRYRLNELEVCDSVMEMINDENNGKYWKILKKLMEMFPARKVSE